MGDGDVATGGFHISQWIPPQPSFVDSANWTRLLMRRRMMKMMRRKRHWRYEVGRGKRLEIWGTLEGSSQ